MLVTLFLLAFGQALNPHSLPSAHFGRVHSVIGLGTAKAYSAPLDIDENGLKVNGGSSAETVPLSAIAWFSVGRNSRALLPNSKASLLNATPYFAGLAFNMIRHQVCLLTFAYVDQHGRLHRPVLLLPEDQCETVRGTLASLGVHEHNAPLHPALDFPKDRLVTGPKKFPVTRTTTIRVLDVSAGSGGTPDVFQSLLYEQTIASLEASRSFRQVLRAGETAEHEGNVLTLSLLPLAFQDGRPRVREVTGFAGKARLTARIVLQNHAGEVLREGILNGVATGHADAFDACRTLAVREAKSFQPQL